MMETTSNPPSQVSRVTAASQAQAPMLVGREHELTDLVASIDRVLTTQRPESITLVGAAGIGKTRLLRDLRTRVQDRARVLYASAADRGPAFAAIHDMLCDRFDLDDTSDDEAGRERFRETVVSALGDERVAEFLHFLGAYVGLHFPESPLVEAIDDDPHQFSLVSRAVLRRFFEVDAQTKPLVLVFEDLHRATDDMLNLVQYLVRSLHRAPIVIIMATQPELLGRRPQWTAEQPGQRHRRLDVAPLDVDNAAALMQQLLSPLSDPPDELVETAVDIAAGSPYLLEEMARIYRRTGVVTVRDNGKVDVDLSRLDRARLPMTMESAIEARIMALSPQDREVLEMAATIGSSFWLGGLVALYRMEAKAPDLWGGHESTVAHIQDQLARLMEREFIAQVFESSIAGETEFMFLHNLERETIVKHTHRARAESWHKLVGEWLEVRLDGRAEAQCDLLAPHFEHGGAAQKAARYYVKAGDQAREHHSNVKAVSYYSRGLELLGDNDLVTRLRTLHHYGDVLQLVGRNDAAMKAFRSMLDIAFHLNLKEKGGAAHNRIGRLFRATGKLDEAMRHLGTGLALFESVKDVRGIASSHDDVGKVHWMRGNYGAAERFLKQALTAREELGDRRGIALTYNNLGLVYQDSGRFAEALKSFQQALTIQQDIGDKAGMAQTMNNLGTIYQDNSDHENAVVRYKNALVMAKEVGDRMRQAIILTNLGESHYRLRMPADAIALLTEAEEISVTLGDLILEGEILRGLAKAHLLLGDVTVAMDLVERAIERFETAKGKSFLGTALRTKGEIHAHGPWNAENAKAADAAFRRAMALFEELGNDIELARSCEILATFLESGPSWDKAEVAALWARANAVRVRQQDPEDDTDSNSAAS